jgi:hypothetical protein
VKHVVKYRGIGYVFLKEGGGMNSSFPCGGTKHVSAKFYFALSSAILAITLFPRPSAARDIELNASVLARSIDCGTEGATRVVFSGPVEFQIDPTKVEVPLLEIKCSIILFKDDASLRYVGPIKLTAEKRLLGAVKIIGSGGSNGADAAPTPALWQVVTARDGNDGSRGSSGQNAHTRVEWKKVRIGPFKTKMRPKYRNESAEGGGNGRSGTAGEAGKDGSAGASGLNGGSGAAVTINAAAITRDTRISVEVLGGPGGQGGLGGRGWDGGAGGNGGNGGEGGDGNSVHSGKSGGSGGNGAIGGNGGDGGIGGAGGNGGNGGNVAINIWNGKYTNDQLIILNEGGKGGLPGAGGAGGYGGKGGRGGLAGCGGSGGSFAFFRTGSGSCGTDGKTGESGLDGKDGVPGVDGVRGHDGNKGILKIESIEPTDDL